MFTRYKTQGFFIKKNNKEEADQLFTIYTKDFGKLEILGRAIRKIKSKLRGGAELFYLSKVEFIQGKTYKTLTDTVLINNFSNIRNDFEKLRIACQISENLVSLIKEQELDEEIWQLLNEVFNKLNTRALARSEETSSLLDAAPRLHSACVGEDEALASSLNWEIRNWKLEILYYYFFWNFVSILGYQPRIKDFYIFYRDKKEKISVDIFKILRIFLKRDLKTLLKLKLESSHQKSLKNISQRYFEYVLKKY